jgi:hypothetical protein
MKSNAYSMSMLEPFGRDETAHSLRHRPTGPGSPITFGSPESVTTGLDIWMRRRPATVTLPSVSLISLPYIGYSTTEEEIEYLLRIPVGTQWRRQHIGGHCTARPLKVEGDKVHALYSPNNAPMSTIIKLDILDFLTRYERMRS